MEESQASRPSAPPASTLNGSGDQIPGKVFLLGEYAVLLGEPALISATEPFFETQSCGTFVPHPESPAGKLQQKYGQDSKTFGFSDPLQGAGGFGASTAQFIGVYRSLASHDNEIKNSVWNAWDQYRELTKAPEGGVSPSGADLVAQWMGGVTYVDLQNREAHRIELEFPWEKVWIFSATHQSDRKVATHTHLALNQNLLGILESRRAALVDWVQKATTAVETKDLPLFGRCLSEYGRLLCQLDLEIPATTRDRQKIEKLSGVLGVKGAGALQADAIVVAVEEDRPSLMRVIESMGYHFVCTANSQRAGVEK